MITFDQAAWSWVDHLRHGGSTPWVDWTAAAPAGRPPQPSVPLPGAAELELVRRLAERAPDTVPPAAFTALADLVLGRSGPGRGLPQLPLLWPSASQRSPVGAPPTDPATVPAVELVRVGVGTFVDLLLREDPRGENVRPVRRRPWTRPFQLLGAPVTADDVRAWLRAAGHVEGGRRPEVLLFAAPFDVHLAQVWSARVQRGAAVRWESFVDRWARRDALPPAARLAALGGRWAERVGPGRVHVVVAADPDAARRTAAQVLGLHGRERPGHRSLRALSPAGTDLLCRVNRVLGVRVPAEQQRVVLCRAAGLLPTRADAPPVLPERHRDWARSVATHLADALRSGHYAVHGELGGIAVRDRSGAPRPRERDVLDLVLDACLALAGPVQRAQEAR